MKLEEWEVEGPFEPGSVEECYKERVKSAQGGDVYMAARLLRIASIYISKEKSMPKPLADYMTTILTQVENEASGIEGDSAKRARRIVAALNLNRDFKKRKMTEQESLRTRQASLAKMYMYVQIEIEGVAKYAAAKEAAKKFPEAVNSGQSCNDDGRAKAYINLYDRSPYDIGDILSAFSCEIIRVTAGKEHSKNAIKSEPL